MFKRYVRSKRHTMQVDYDDYLYELKQERKRGARRSSTVPLRHAPTSLAIAPDGRSIWVASARDKASSVSTPAPTACTCAC